MPGRQRMKVGGGAFVDIRSRRVRRKDLVQPYAPAAVKFEIRFRSACLKPLGKLAEDLLADYFLNAAFWDSAVERGQGAEWAGLRILRTKKAQSHKRLADLRKSGGPLALFRLRALVGMQELAIPRGSDTAPSDLARAFYSVLAGDGARSDDCYRDLSPAQLKVFVERDRGHIPAICRAEAHDFTVRRLLEMGGPK